MGLLCSLFGKSKEKKGGCCDIRIEEVPEGQPNGAAECGCCAPQPKDADRATDKTKR